MDDLTAANPIEEKHTHTHTNHTTPPPTTKTDIKGTCNHWPLIFLNYQWTKFAYKKTQANRRDLQTESILLLYTRNTPQLQRQTLPQSKILGKDFPIKWT